MNEEQRKPKKKWYDIWSFILIPIIILAIFAIVLYVSTSEYEGIPIDTAYNTAKEQIQNAVTGYAYYNNGSLPTLSGTYTNANCSGCHVVNMSALLTSNDGLMREAPYCLNLSASGNDNCGGNASLGCSNGSSYIWIVDTHGTWSDTYGSVHSYCAGAGCKTNNSGYQGVWP